MATSPQVQLPSDSYSFDTGEVNEFSVSIEDVGEVRSVALRMEVTDSDSTWHLDKLQVRSSEACGGGGIDATFSLEDWVPPSTQVLLFPKATGAADYEVLVFTADMRGAGTDGRVEIKVCEALGQCR